MQNFVYGQRRFLMGLIGLCFVPLLIGAVQAPRVVDGPDQLPHVENAMLSPAYWIDRLEQPDRVLLTPQQIKEKSEQWQAQGLVHTLGTYGSFIPKHILRTLLKSDDAYLQRVGRYKADGSLMMKMDYDEIKKNVNTSSLEVSNKIRWGLTVRRTALRLFPTKDIVTSKPGDLEFNVLLHSGLRLAEPVIVLHESLDHQWYFVDSSVGFGWVVSQDVAWTEDAREIENYCLKAEWVVSVCEAEFLDKQNKLMNDTAWMGCHLASDPENPEMFLIPRKNNFGQLSYASWKLKKNNALRKQDRVLSPRALIEQAFILQGQSYGWGGGSGVGDCSEFIRRIGLVCGIEFPRSTQGLKTGLASVKLSSDPKEKKRQLAASPGGASLLYLPGHIMLVLGQVNDHVFVIHNLYGIHAQDSMGPLIRRVARVVVSDLSLGQTSQKGTLFQRVSERLEFIPGLDKEHEIE